MHFATSHFQGDFNDYISFTDVNGDVSGDDQSLISEQGDHHDENSLESTREGALNLVSYIPLHKRVHDHSKYFILDSWWQIENIYLHLGLVSMHIVDSKGNGTLLIIIVIYFLSCIV